MVIRGYLKGDEVKSLQGFVDKKTEHGDRYFVGDIKVDRTDGRWFISFDACNPIPAIFSPLVVEVSLREDWSISGLPDREPGKYCLETARGEYLTRAEHRLPSLEIQAEKVTDLLALRDKILSGTIQPTESFAGPQTGVSRDDLKRSIDLIRRNAAEFLARIRLSWRSPRKESVVEFLERIIDKH